MPKKKVAILGGGCAAMSAAYYLSNTEDLRDALEVTVYQIGWRLGGKGACGRDLREGYGERILEHGLHVWGGFYYNAFRMIRDAYVALKRPAACPLRNWDDAFKKRPLVAWEEEIDGKYRTWPLCTPIDDEVPGSGELTPDPIDLFIRLIRTIIDAVEDWPHDEIRLRAKTPGPHPYINVLTECGAVIEEVAGDIFDGSPLSALRTVFEIAQVMRAKDLNHTVQDQLTLVTALRAFHQWLRDAHGDPGSLSDELRRLLIMTDLGLTAAWGMFKDAVIRRGFMSIDDYDLRAWLAKHDALQITLDSAALRGYYDYFFAYADGDPRNPQMSAGMGLCHLLRLVVDYKGSLFWKMTAGMGDAVFAPLYEICSRNGVKFKFFHRVTSVLPDDDGKSIAAVRINRQVDLANGEYEPLISTRNVPSWPAEPLYQFIDATQAEKLKADSHIDLEDPWTDWAYGTDIELQAGRDFDAVVLGLSIGAFPAVCKPIIDRDEAWATMVEKIPAIQTQALQIWFNKSMADLGWNPRVQCNKGPQGNNTTGTGYASPHQSWSDMTPVIPIENWPAGNEPKSVVYFCGPMPTASMPSGIAPEFGERQTAIAQAAALDWTRENLAHLFPGFDWNTLFDPTNAQGEDRFANQFVRANYTPTERYVVDLPGTNRYRLEADTSGYTNLALAGDWLFTGLGGAVESAVIAGMQAARGVAGSISEPIAGETRSPWRRPVSLVPLIDPDVARIGR